MRGIEKALASLQASCTHPEWKFVALSNLTEPESGEFHPVGGFVKVCIKCEQPIKNEEREKV